MTKALHDLAKKKVVVGLTEAHTSYGFRHGAVDDMIFGNPSLGIACIINRGGWSLKDQQTKMSYMSGGNWMHYVSFNREQLEGGLLLQGFPNTQKCPEAPTIFAFATETNIESVDNLASQLFVQHDNEMLHTTGCHRSLIQTALAFHLMYLKTMEKQHPPNEKNMISEAIINEAYSLGISKSQLYEWGDKIRDRFFFSKDRAHDLYMVKGTLEKAVAAIVSNNVSREILAKVDLKVGDVSDMLKEHSKEQKKENEDLKSEVKLLQEELKQLTNIIRGIVGEKVASLTVNTTNAKLSPVTSPATSPSAEEPEPETAFDLLQQAQKNLANDVDRNRFHQGKPNLMSTGQFAARVLIYNKNLRVPKVSPFTFPILSGLKTKLNKVYDEVRRFLTDEEREIKPRDVEMNNTGPIYEMFARAQLRMLPDIYSRIEKEDKNWKRPKGAITNDKLTVGTVVTQIEKLDKSVNKRLEAEGKKKKRKKRQKTK